MAGAIKYCANFENMSTIRDIIMDEFAPLLADSDLNVRTAAFKSLAYLGKFYTHIVRGLLNEKFFLPALDMVLPYNEKFINVIEFGGGVKQKNDRALELRTTAYQFIYDFLGILVKKIPVVQLMRRVLHGFSKMCSTDLLTLLDMKEYFEIKELSCKILLSLFRTETLST